MKTITVRTIYMTTDDKWLSPKEYAERFGTKIDTVHTLISMNRDKYPQYFKKVGRGTHIAEAYRYHHFASEELRMEVETLYFKALEKFGRDYRISRLIAEEFDIKIDTVNMRFFDFKFGTRKVAEEAREHLQYVLDNAGEIV